MKQTKKPSTGMRPNVMQRRPNTQKPSPPIKFNLHRPQGR